MTDGRQFESSEKLIQHIKEKCDDIDCVCINLAGGIRRTKPDGTTSIVAGVGAIIQYCDKSTSIIHFQDAELLLNDGILNKLRIPIRLVPEGESLTNN